MKKRTKFNWDNSMFKTMTNAEIAAKTGQELQKVAAKRFSLRRGDTTVPSNDEIGQNATLSPGKKAALTRKLRAASSISPTTADLHFVVNGLNLYVNNGCKNVYVRKDRVEITF